MIKSTMIKLLACASVAMLAATAASADDAGFPATAPTVISNNVISGPEPATPAWLNSESHDVYMGPGGLFSAATTESSVKLGGGFSFDMASTFYNAPNTTGSNFSVTPLAGPTGLYGAQSGLTYDTTQRISAGAPAASSFGGTVSMDVGNGVSLNFTGGMTRLPGNGFALNAPSALYMSPNSTVATSVGAGVAFDLGNGSSFSISGSMAHSPNSGFAGPCGGFATGFCR